MFVQLRLYKSTGLYETVDIPNGVFSQNSFGEFTVRQSPEISIPANEIIAVTELSDGINTGIIVSVNPGLDSDETIEGLAKHLNSGDEVWQH